MEKDLKAQILASNAQGGGGTTYTAGDGINITGDVISIDSAVIDQINGVGTQIAVSDTVTITQELQPNTQYEIDADTTCTTLTLTLATPVSGVYSPYSASIKCGATPPTFTAITGVTWDGTFALVANKTTLIFIENGRGLFYAV